MKTSTVQNVFLVASAALPLAMLCCVMCSAEGGEYSIRFADSFAFVVLSLVPFIINMIALCNSGRPQIRLRLSTMSAIVLLAYQIWIAVVFFRFHHVYVFHLPSVFPSVALILDILAIRYIIRELSFSAAIEIKKTMDAARKTKKK